MGRICYFCEEKDRVSYFSYFCDECATLRRLLLINSPKKCIDILRRTLTRDDQQLDFKVQQEIKSILCKDIRQKKNKDNEDSSYLTRSKNKI